MIANISGYFLKVCVFRDAALQGRFSKWFFEPVARTMGNLWFRCMGMPAQFVARDENRLKKSADFLAQFTETREVETEDGVTLKWALFTPQKFNQWIDENGGVREGEWIRPRSPGDWDRLQRLREFKWFEEVGHSFKVPALVAGAEEKCVLRCNGFGRSIATDKSFIGLHLAAGFNYAVFDWRKEISAKGYFQDAETVYQAVRQVGFTTKEIKPLGYCGTTFVVAHLKEKHHHEGLDVVMIGAHTSLRDTIKYTMWPANRIGLMGLSTIEHSGADFDTLRKFESLPPGNASTCLIMNQVNKIVANDTVALLTTAVEKTGRCTVILKPENCEDAEFNFNHQFRIDSVRERYFNFLIS